MASKNAKKKKKSKKKIIEEKKGNQIPILRTTGLHISHPSLYQLSYDSMFNFLKLQLPRLPEGILVKVSFAVWWFTWAPSVLVTQHRWLFAVIVTLHR